EWVHVQLHQQKGMISLSPPTICNSAQHKKSFPSSVGNRSTLMDAPDYGKQVNFADGPDYGKQVNFTGGRECGEQVNFADGPD
ncbi:hypothetical protein, partial [Escherichia coli]|uniref:hypothetical protein n=1 Tax=Escherichia coli TaxID=562 RepID=UPI00202BB25F